MRRKSREERSENWAMSFFLRQGICFSSHAQIDFAYKVSFNILYNIVFDSRLWLWLWFFSSEEESLVASANMFYLPAWGLVSSFWWVFPHAGFVLTLPIAVRMLFFFSSALPFPGKVYCLFPNWSLPCRNGQVTCPPPKWSFFERSWGMLNREPASTYGTVL